MNPFVGLTHLKYLNLQNCDLSQLTSDSFRHCPNINTLLVHNSKKMSDLDLSPLIHLNSLSLSGISSLNILKTVNPELETLYLSRSADETIMDEFSEVIRRFNNLKELSIYDCKLLEFDINWLANPLILEYLKIKRCQMVTLNLKLGLPILILNKHHNFIQSDLDTKPKRLDNLKELYIDNNLLRIFILDDLPILNKLGCKWLSDDRITSIPKNMFRYFPTLTWLNLSSNHIESLEDNAFSVLSNLETLNLECNRLTEVREAAFGGLVKLKHLNLRENQIREIKLSSDLVNLEYLILEFCRVNQVKETFSGLKNLTHLDLLGNPFGFIDPNMFLNMRNLKLVRLNRENTRMEPRLIEIYQDKIKFSFSN